MSVGTIRVGKITASGGDGTYTFTEQLRKADNSGWENASAGAGVVGGTVRDVNDSTAGAVDDLIAFWLESGLGGSTQYVCDVPAKSVAVPTGTVLMYTGPMGGSNVPPTGYLWANGQAVSRTTYAALFAIISTTYGVGDGSSTFNVPDTRDKFWKGSNTNSDRGTTGGLETLDLDHNHPGTWHQIGNFVGGSQNYAVIQADVFPIHPNWLGTSDPPTIDEPDAYHEIDNEPPWWNGPGIIKT